MKLEKEFPFLGRAREKYGQPAGGLDDLTFTIVDIETTGLDPFSAEILEVGAIKSRAGQARDVFHSFIRPVAAIPSAITSLTGITPEMVAGAPFAPQALDQFLKFIQGTILVAHNTEFDIAFLDAHMRKGIDKNLDLPALCTVKLSRALMPALENYKLHTVARALSLSTPNRHRAMGDAEITQKVWTKLLERLKVQGKKSLADISHFLEQNFPKTPDEVPF